MMIPLLIWTLGQCLLLQFLFILSCLSHMPMILFPYPLISSHQPLFQLHPEYPLVSSRNLGIFVTITTIWWMLHTKFPTIHPIPSPRFFLRTCSHQVTVPMLFPSHYILSPNSIMKLSRVHIGEMPCTRNSTPWKVMAPSPSFPCHSKKHPLVVNESSKTTTMLIAHFLVIKPD